MIMTEKNNQESLESVRQIEKSYSLKWLKNILAKLSKNELSIAIEVARYYGTEDIKKLINKRVIFLKEYYSKANKNQEYKSFSPRYNEKEQEELEKDLKIYQRYAENTDLTTTDLIKLKSLSKDTIKEDEIKANQQRRNKEEAKQSLIKETLTTINRIGTNINQIARDFNERRLFSNNNNLTREEKERMLEATEKLEETLMHLINNSNNYDN
jgi:hypothetical protein